ncbi:MAG: type II toxin-antitoxin system RelE/ParE family toxin [Sulfuricurvum sp.]|nr:type II toxin-antitoxin system RelE/ParE family toxin [Sulfuricurvum sp.]
MRVRKSNRFKNELKQIVKFIGESNPKNAERFYYVLMDRLDSLVDHPRKGRSTENGGREMIYKGYTIPYLIDEENIVILGIFNQNEWSNKEQQQS